MPAIEYYIKKRSLFGSQLECLGNPSNMELASGEVPLATSHHDREMEEEMSIHKSDQDCGVSLLCKNLLLWYLTHLIRLTHSCKMSINPFQR
jgi:hypothetical protein